MTLYSSSEMLGLVAHIYLQKASLVIGKAAKHGGLSVAQFMEKSPEVARRGLKLTRKLHMRFQRGNYTHNEGEMELLEHYCEWLIDVGQTLSKNPVRPFKLDRASLVRKTPFNRSYGDVIARVRQL